MNVKPVSTKPKSSLASRGCVFVFGLVFMFAGLGFLGSTLVYPIIRTQTAGDWQKTPCTITSSEVVISSDSDSTKYRPKIVFEYTVANEIYVGESYDFTSLNRPRKRCKQIVSENPAGTQTSCFVNPDAPDDAVIVPSYDFPWLGLIVPFVIAVIGTGIAVASLFLSSKPSNSISGSTKAPSQSASSALGLASRGKMLAGTSGSSQHPADIEDQNWDKPQKLKAQYGRLTSLLCVLAIAVFWNGIVSFFAYTTIGQGFSILFVLFLIPFIIVGLILIAAFFQKLGALFNPKVELALTTGAVQRGDSVDVAWQLEGRTSMLRSLSIKVEGGELATYRRGTDTITARNVFCTIDVVEVQSKEDIEFGSQTLTIPVDTMHTFKGDRNKVSWQIVVHGDIPWWPDIREQYEFRVKP